MREKLEAALGKQPGELKPEKTLIRELIDEVYQQDDAEEEEEEEETLVASNNGGEESEGEEGEERSVDGRVRLRRVGAAELRCMPSGSQVFRKSVSEGGGFFPTVFLRESSSPGYWVSGSDCRYPLDAMRLPVEAEVGGVGVTSAAKKENAAKASEAGGDESEDGGGDIGEQSVPPAPVHPALAGLGELPPGISPSDASAHLYAEDAIGALPGGGQPPPAAAGAVARETADLSWLKLLPPKHLKPLCEEKGLPTYGAAARQGPERGPAQGAL